MHNPFAALPASIPPIAMQIYVAVMFLLVVCGTLVDLAHKGSAKYFFKHRRIASFGARRRVAAGETAALAAKTIVVSVLAAGEFCGILRRVTHLLTMYGFVLYVVTTAVMVFAYPTAAAPGPAIVPELWYLGAVLVCVGGLWFWLLQRVDVVAEGRSPLRLVRADLFVLSLLASAAFALIWGGFQASGDHAWANASFGLYLLSNTVLFGSVPWSKFAHMFYKPAAALQRRIEHANGFRANLPAPADRPAAFGSARRQPHNY
ncbi:MAG: adenylyl-sulfate reductase [Gammaproteobacteria bacterium]